MLKMWHKGKDLPLLLKLKLQPYHGGEFVGNDCHKPLKNMNVLQRVVEREKPYAWFCNIIPTFEEYC